MNALVFYEMHPDMTEAMRREKQLKKWNRGWKIEPPQKENPQWLDLWLTIIG